LYIPLQPGRPPGAKPNGPPVASARPTTPEAAPVAHDYRHEATLVTPVVAAR